MNRPLSDERRRRLESAGRKSKADRNRLIGLIVAFVLVIGVYYQVGKGRAPSTEEEGGPPTQEILPSVTSLPPVDPGALSEVRDGTPTERIILEPEPFRYLASLAQALLPSHLRAMGEPALPFADIEMRSAELRGRAYRVRGSLVAADSKVRVPGGPEEFWCHIRTDEGDEVFFVSLRVPDELFGSENYVLADGFFFKNYTQTLEGERLTAPLLVGRMLRPSFRVLAPTVEIDRNVLAEVRDHERGEEAPLDQDALWHLVNVAQSVGRDPQLLDEIFGELPLMGFEELQDIARDPPLYRGQPMIIPGIVVDGWTETLEENPLRLRRMSYAYLGSMELGDHPLHLIAPGEVPFAGRKARRFLGWFLQLKGYVDKMDVPRRTPVFVIAAEQDFDLGPEPFVGQMTFWFLGGAIALSAFITWLALRDRQRARNAEAMLRERRRRRTGSSAS